MKTDYDFKIGASHEICEDYALSGVLEEKAYAIVCDGCSGSEYVDVGARLIAHAAKGSIISGLRGWTHESFSQSILVTLENALRFFPSLTHSSFDSTLLVAYVQKGMLRAFIYGDGMVIHKKKNGLMYIHVSFSLEDNGVIKTAPDYLSYRLSQERLDGFESWTANQKIVDNTGTKIVTKPFCPLSICEPVEIGDVIVLCSDGIDSFRRLDGTPIPFEEMISEFSNFPNTEGEFVTRRLNALDKKCKSTGTSHFDDISIAAIVV